MGRKSIDLTDQKFGRLIVLNLTGRDKWGQSLWRCECECGNIAKVRGRDLRTGNSLSCGCLHKEVVSERLYKHGDSGYNPSRLYYIWQSMKKRCYSPNCRAYKWYGGRGIQVCPEWLSDFVIFKTFALDYGYKDDLTIDRINNDGNYTKDNCRFITLSENVKNKKVKSLFVMSS